MRYDVLITVVPCSTVCVYYRVVPFIVCNCFIKACVCLLLQDLVQNCLNGGGGGGYGRTCATRDDEPRPVWTRLLITH
jgi:hypothetical protein